jgi:hypothetical protein
VCWWCPAGDALHASYPLLHDGHPNEVSSSVSQYFSDREESPRPRTQESITAGAWGGVVAAITGRISDGSFGASFPLDCPDGLGTIGTNPVQMGLAVLGDIPRLSEFEPMSPPPLASDSFTGWPLRADRVPPTLAILDLVEFCFRHIAEPIEISHHSYFGHSHLQFERAAGQATFLASINGLFVRNGLAFELTDNGRVIRLGVPLVGDVLRLAVFATGDLALDQLLERAREKYLSADPAHRAESVEQLWDALERSKTILASDKKSGVRMLIARTASTPELAERFDAEMSELTRIGNDFRIRHHESTKVELKIGDIDYLFHRCFALLAYLLRLNPNPTRPPGAATP